MGKAVYLTDYELQMIYQAFDPANIGFDGDPDEDRKIEVSEKIRNKFEKALWR
ncbi:hypothetical protein M2277_000840 [Paenibacillus sp. LBL]|uniref:hypothetical protein n=1 Tax=Paenibacillus sp. LBL TaxID=2940563 RepID=UPI002474CEC8|nr:hypothetical protein [Paenibacillus sp. LBL]MDH6670196.1 hypothetical protein [Paenibacillus sp. LBL]